MSVSLWFIQYIAKCSERAENIVIEFDFKI